MDCDESNGRSWNRRRVLQLTAASAASVVTGSGWAQTYTTRRRIIRNQPQGIVDRLHLNAKAMDDLAALFEGMIKEGLHPGAQLALYRDGELAIELAGGMDGYPEDVNSAPITTDSIFQIRSITKILTTIVMLILHDRGRFSLDDPVSKHWPQFAQNGKDKITIAHVLSHRAGLASGPAIPLDRMDDRAYVARAIEAMEPQWEPGTANGYHASSFGWIADELVHRWEGRGVSELLQTEVLDPLGIEDVYLGLSRTAYARIAKMAVDPGVRRRQSARAEFSDFLNTHAGARLPLAWVGGFATARAMGRLMNLLAYEGTLGDRKIVSKESLQLAAKPTNEPGVEDRVLLWPIRWGLGFILGDTPHIYGTPPHPGARGHAGGGASVAWADPVRRLAVSFMCNRMLARESWDRYHRIGDAVYRCLKT
jgi:CubicO group peptidase (beta-lactamase class C family)